MRKYLPPLLSILCLTACTPDKPPSSPQVDEPPHDMRDFLYVEWEGDGGLLYEYENSNPKGFSAQYLWMERDSSQANTLHYTFLDKDSKMLAAQVERHSSDTIWMQEMKVLEHNPRGMDIVHRVQLEDWAMPYRMEKGKPLDFTTEWPLHLQKGQKNVLESVREFQGYRDSFLLMGQPIQVAEVWVREKVEREDENGKSLQASEYQMRMTYGKGRGLVALEVRQGNSLISRIQLDKVHPLRRLEDFTKK